MVVIFPVFLSPKPSKRLKLGHLVQTTHRINELLDIEIVTRTGHYRISSHVVARSHGRFSIARFHGFREKEGEKNAHRATFF